MGGDVRIGISGWRYPPWRGVFYPKGLPQRLELEYASQHVNSIELNGSFYSLQRPQSYQRWRDTTPDDFVFSVKGGRYITHLLRLKDTQGGLANFFASGMLAFGAKLGPILWQLPATLHFDPDLLEAFLASLPRTTAEAATIAAGHEERMTGKVWFQPDADSPLRHALEVRSATFENPAYFRILEKHNVASVVADTAGKWPRLTEVTADFAYARLHGDKELYTSGYDDEALDRWADTVRGWRVSGYDSYIYFDNDVKVRAPFDAMALQRRLDGPS
ncbi:DUF72 domain-containing protein [Cryobacterium sp. BB736]|uniref:DUF72 domain-containing protein n=1 Tax=Cryobacterium sp. BB736 TaxID=2746963 RepID=UPI001876CC7F|nr:DUF72 domain-containing protein [Cryobacterium sp. BB736]